MQIVITLDYPGVAFGSIREDQLIKTLVETLMDSDATTCDEFDGVMMQAQSDQVAEFQ